MGQGLAACQGTPSASELVRIYEAHSGHPVRTFHYNEVLASFWRGVVLVKILKDYRRNGADIPESMLRDNFPPRHLCGLLALPLPTGDDAPGN